MVKNTYQAILIENLTNNIKSTIIFLQQISFQLIPICELTLAPKSAETQYLNEVFVSYLECIGLATDESVSSEILFRLLIQMQNIDDHINIFILLKSTFTRHYPNILKYISSDIIIRFRQLLTLTLLQALFRPSYFFFDDLR